MLVNGLFSSVCIVQQRGLSIFLFVPNHCALIPAEISTFLPTPYCWKWCGRWIFFEFLSLYCKAERIIDLICSYKIIVLNFQLRFPFFNTRRMTGERCGRWVVLVCFILNWWHNRSTCVSNVMMAYSHCSRSLFFGVICLRSNQMLPSVGACDVTCSVVFKFCSVDVGTSHSHCWDEPRIQKSNLGIEASLTSKGTFLCCRNWSSDNVFPLAYLSVALLMLGWNRRCSPVLFIYPSSKSWNRRVSHFKKEPSCAAETGLAITSLLLHIY